jgi:methyltransferase (TIGR00027 family)
MVKSEIQHVSDTAIWVATYRADESERTDALFHDPLARQLSGEKGKRIAKSMKRSRYTAWSVVIRTFIIDSLIKNLVSKGVDTIVNLGAGLDTRPYRMELPSSVTWIEVDFPHLIQAKTQSLQSEKPRCQLERIALNLADRKARSELLSEIASKSKNILLLTEGVIPYLPNDEVESLAQDIRKYDSFKYWILDYFAPHIYKYLRGMKQLQKSPFQFNPDDWFKFFDRQGWKPKAVKYLTEESERLGRPIPMPWPLKWLRPLSFFKNHDRFKKFSAYVLLEPK